MDRVTVRNFRCFREYQSARLAPLTLLVGENSTGKTSLLALIRILWQTVYFEDIKPNFNQEPFNLGSYKEIVYHEDNDDYSNQEFSGGFFVDDCELEVKFKKGITGPEVFQLSIKNANASAVWTQREGFAAVETKTARGAWYFEKSSEFSDDFSQDFAIQGIWGLISFHRLLRTGLEPKNGDDTSFNEKDRTDLINLIIKLGAVFGPQVAGGPVRSKPQRNYVPGPLEPESNGVPNYLAALANSNNESWKTLKKDMESFGKKIGVFDEIKILSLSNDTSQLQVRKYTGNRKGKWRNIIDVGYGVSQILPVIFELTRPLESHFIFLQQPELHLHPSAQAGLGSILCQAVSDRDKIVLVETHSDQLINRVRMDLRDKKYDLKPEDVSILYFERSDATVNIYNIRIDEDGNIVDQPPSYRKFFRQEVNRSVGI